MDFDDAIFAHSDWKRKLRSYLSKVDHSLTVGDVDADDRCKLGEWIAGEGRQLRFRGQLFRRTAVSLTLVDDFQ